MIMNDAIILQCRMLCKRYQEGLVCIDALKNVNFSMHDGEMVSIIGSSGSGKSTFLHLLGGLDTPTSGEVIYSGKILNTMSSSAKAELRNREIGFIYQFHYLLPDFTVLENVAMPLLIGKKKLVTAITRAKIILEIVGLGHRSKHRPSELSGGERQRVAIARALANKPRLILADEPTGSLDEKNSENIFKLLNDLNHFQGTSFLVVTHNSQLAQCMDRQFKMCDGHLII